MKDYKFTIEVWGEGGQVFIQGGVADIDGNPVAPGEGNDIDYIKCGRAAFTAMVTTMQAKGVCHVPIRNEKIWQAG